MMCVFLKCIRQLNAHSSVVWMVTYTMNICEYIYEDDDDDVEDDDDDDDTM